MSILIFIAVIVVLIVVHEIGHFIAAKISGMRVDEFGIGYPPRALTIAKVGGTEYTLNWLPFGGFVKIFGEDGEKDGESDPRAFGRRPRVLQAIVLVAGIAMNMLLAYVLITAALVMGTPRALSDAETLVARDMQLMVANVLPSSPAATAGLLPGDAVIRAQDKKGEWSAVDPLDEALGTSVPLPKSFSAFIAAGRGSEVTLTVVRNTKEKQIVATPIAGIAPSDPSRFALGVEVATVGIVPLSFFSSITEGAILTWEATKMTAVGLVNFFYGVFTMTADLSQVAGPVGIAGVVGSASDQGFGNLLSIMAIISINLAIINLIPIPALDGGRLLFVIIESVIRRPINPRFAYSLNAIGFVFLILLMVVVTAHDIFNIVK